MTQDELARLRDLASKATPGPWRLDSHGVFADADDVYYLIEPGESASRADAEYIAALSPDVLARLLDLAEEVLP